jgi:uncharacterized membrane protein
MFRRVIAVLVLLVVAVVALKLAVGLVVGLVSAVLWIVVIAALIVGVLWARKTLKAPRREKTVKRSQTKAVSAPAEDPVEVEMRRITEQLREQGRR